MRIKFIFFLVILFPLFLVGCTGIFSEEETVPTRDYDIVFQTEIDGKSYLGFYTLATGNSIKLNMTRGLTSPYVLEDGSLIALWQIADFGDPRIGVGYLQILRETPDEATANFGDPRTNIGKIAALRQKSQGLFCKIDDFFTDLIGPFGNLLVFESIRNGKLNIVDSRECIILGELFNLEDVGISDENHKSLQGFSVNTDSKILVLSVKDRNLQTYNLIRANLVTKEIISYEKFGINPSISPDGKKVAYLSEDGIRIMDIGGKDVLKVTNDNPWVFDSIFPKPEWSQDGLKLIYHRCPDKDTKSHTCNNYENFSVFLFDIKTGVERKLFDTGVYPSWIPK